MKREEIEKVYDQGKEAVVELVEGLITEFTNKINELTARIASLEKQLGIDSHNSSKPPSTDGMFNKKRKRTKSLRKRSKKKSGGQEGHEGKTLELSDKPNKRVRIKAGRCSCCGKSLKGCSLKGIDRRQEIEIPEINPYITEYQSEITDCPNCGKENRGSFPEWLTHRVQYGNYLKSLAIYFRNYELLPSERTAEIFEDIFSIPLSEGTLYNTMKSCADKLDTFQDWIIRKLIGCKIVNFDESGINIGGSLHWLHSSSTDELTYYYPHKRRGKVAFDEINILPNFLGYAVHDHWQSYYHYDCYHILCNAHHLRELTYVYESEGQEWANKMIRLLCEIKEEVDKRREKGELIDESLQKKYERKYNRLIREGLLANPPPAVDETVKKRGRKKKGKVLNLLIRLKNHKKEILASMYDINIPFDNNLAERDIRMIKVQQKISGLFRSKAGAHQFCIIRSFISTAKKQGLNIINAINDILNGNQIYLNFSC